MEEKFKYKPLTKSQIIISLDRLTRFKPTEDKYLRVFKDILVSNLIIPKFKKKQLDLIDYELLTNLVEEIFNSSLTALNIDLTKDFTINAKLFEYEDSIFKSTRDVKKLLNNKLDYLAAINLLEDEDKDNLPLNLKWLESLSENENQIKTREEKGLKFPINKIIITEGITEEILFPKFSKLCGYDLDKMGVNLISAGGKNQVVKLFYQLVEVVKLPIFVLLDNDASENLDEIYPKLRKFDKVYLIKNGEFEDILPLKLIKRTLNRYLKNFDSVEIADLRKDLPMTSILSDLFKQKGFNEFKKAEFAHLVAQSIQSEDDVSDEIKTIVSEIKYL